MTNLLILLCLSGCHPTMYSHRYRLFYNFDTGEMLYVSIHCLLLNSSRFCTVGYSEPVPGFSGLNLSQPLLGKSGPNTVFTDSIC